MSFFFILCLLSFQSKGQSIAIDDIRKDYASAVNNQNTCEKWYARFQKESNLSAKLKAYKGAIAITLARFVAVAKKTPLVMQGKKLIEDAINQDKNDVEIRFIRYGIQIHLPAALAYNKNKTEDRLFINAHLNQFPNEAMKAAVIKFLEETKSK